MLGMLGWALVGIGAGTALAASEPAEVVQQLLDKDKVERANKKCQGWDAHAPEADPALRQVCARAALRALEGSLDPGVWLEHADQWPGTDAAGDARDRAAALTLEGLDAGAPFEMWWALAQDYDDTASHARLLQGAEDALFARVEQDDTVAGWAEFQQVFPDSERAPQALEAEGQAALRDAQAVGSVQAWTALAWAYPQHVNEAVAHAGPLANEAVAQACEAGELAACTLRGEQLRSGQVGPRDGAQGTALLVRSCDQGHTLACVALVEDLPAEEQLDALAAGCQDGSAQACELVGLRGGMTRALSREQARASLERACALGSGASCVSLAWPAPGETADAERVVNGLELLAQACQGGSLDACVTLIGSTATAERMGVDVWAHGPELPKRDQVVDHAAMGLLLRCHGGSPTDCDQAVDVVADSRWSPHVDVDTLAAQAVAQRDAYCAAGDGIACARLALTISSARYADQDDVRALALFERAVELGGADVLEVYGVALRGGQLLDQETVGEAQLFALIHQGSAQVAVDTVKGLKRAPGRDEGPWILPLVDRLERDCEEGSLHACALLVGVYTDGVLVPRDETARLHVLDTTCTAGGAAECLWLGRMWHTGSHPDQAGIGPSRWPVDYHARVVGGTGGNAYYKPALALDYYAQGCALGDAEACALAAEMQWWGLEVAPQPAQGLDSLERACGLGDADACARHVTWSALRNPRGVTRLTCPQGRVAYWGLEKHRGDHVIEQQCRVSNGITLVADGPMSQSRMDGTLLVRGQVAEGRKVGTWTFYDERGRVSSTHEY